MNWDWEGWIQFKNKTSQYFIVKCVFCVIFTTCPEDVCYVLQNFENLQDTLSCISFYFANSGTATDDPSPFLAQQKLHDFLQVALDDDDCCACQAKCVPTKIERPSKLAWGSCISCKIFVKSRPNTNHKSTYE